MMLSKQNVFPKAHMNHWLGAAHTTNTVLASLWVNNMEIAVNLEIYIFTPIKKQGIPSIWN